MFEGENISFDASLVIYVNSTNIPPIMIINWIHEIQNPSVAVTCFLPDRAKDLSASLYIYIYTYKGADKSLARLTSGCILFDGENTLFDAVLLYI